MTNRSARLAMYVALLIVVPLAAPGPASAHHCVPDHPNPKHRCLTPAPPESEPTAEPAEPTTEPVEPTAEPVPTGKAELRPVGSPPLSDSEAAARVTPVPWEPRPGNTLQNHTVPTKDQIDYWNSQPENSWAKGQVTGNFTGTTDEIIQWAAHKWGWDEDVFRAVAAVESWWDQNAGGPEYQGGGLMSMTWSQSPGSLPIGMDSTAWNIDYFAGSMRWYFDGHATWLNHVERGRDYAAGDAWGSIGAWYAGRWYTDGANWYIDKVQRYMNERVWEGF